MAKSISVSALPYDCQCGQCGYTLVYETVDEIATLRAKVRFCLDDGSCPTTSFTLSEDQLAMAPDALMQSLHAQAVTQWEAAA